MLNIIFATEYYLRNRNNKKNLQP